MRVGLVGAGYISDFHVKAILREHDADLVAVCDLNVQAAKTLVDGIPGVEIYSDLDLMLAEQSIDVVHILTQPDSHFLLISKVLNTGCNVVVEKPAVISLQQAKEIKQLAEKNKHTVAVNHNFLFSRPFLKLREIIAAGGLGPLKSVRVVWKKELPQSVHGPWGLWMLRDPGNVLFETGSHSLSEVLALVDPVDVIAVNPRQKKILPSGVDFYRRWDIVAKSGSVAINIEKYFDKGYEQHYVEVEGVFGVAKADIENDIFTVDMSSGLTYDAERLNLNFKNGLSKAGQAMQTFSSYLSSKFISSATGGPYETSMLNGIENCYEELRGTAGNPFSSLDYALSITDVAESLVGYVPASENGDQQAQAAVPNYVSEPEKEAKILIIGASGFIGRRLLESLQNDSRGVRALVRNPSSMTGMVMPEHCELMVGDYRNEEVMVSALKGVEYVYHLAVSHGNSLGGYLKSDSDPTIRLAQQCQAQNVKRFIYTGTIDSLYLGPGAGRLKEQDGVDSKIKRRNNYAHSKAITERRLLEMHETLGFPVVIMRPAIVLGPGGAVTHLGVANWLGLGRCRFWGKGENLLPTILVDDVVTALTSALNAKDIGGKTYNLSAEPCITARDYVDEVGKTLNCTIKAEPSLAVKSYLIDLMKWSVKVLARHPDRVRVPSLRDWQCREQHASFDTSSAQQDLNWKAVNEREVLLEKGVRLPAKEYLLN